MPRCRPNGRSTDRRECRLPDGASFAPSFAVTLALAASLFSSLGAANVLAQTKPEAWSPYRQYDGQQPEPSAAPRAEPKAERSPRRAQRPASPPAPAPAAADETGRRAAPGAAANRSGAVGWSSRGEHDAPAAGNSAPASAGLPLDRQSRAVESTDLTPVMATDGSALPYELWRGLDTAAIEQLMGSLTIPPRSAALHSLWRRLITSSVEPPAAGQGNAHFEALRLEALYRSGLLDQISEIVQKDSAGAAGSETPLVAMIAARSDIGLQRREAGCQRARRLGDIRGDIPKSLRGEAVLVSGYCAAATGDAAAAGLLAELAREEGISASPGLAALDAIAAGTKPAPPKLGKDQRLTLVDYRILELAGAPPAAAELIAHASPALLVAIARDSEAPATLRLEAAEAAARLNAIEATALAEIYRTQGAAGANTAALGNATLADAASNTAQRRAALFAAAEAERTPFKKVRLIRSLIDNANRAGLALPILVLAARLSADIGLAPEIGWFAETAIEANLAAGDYAKARMWSKFAGSLDAGGGAAGGPRGGLGHWNALIDIADPEYPEARGGALAAVERMALSGRFSTDLLHRLATVLDALDYQVPIPLWEAASRTSQPSAGHLPATGVLSQLQQASVKKEFGRTVLLAMQTLGPDGADRAHMIGLGDAIRALRRAGLDKDARRLGLEALLGGWPRATSS